GLDQLADAAAQHRLLPEEVGLRLPEGGLDHTPAGAADALRVLEHEVARVPARVLVDSGEARHAVALDELAPDEVPWSLGRNEADVHLRPRVDFAVVDREPVGEQEQVARRN